MNSDEQNNNPIEQMSFKAGNLRNLTRDTISAIQRQYDEHNIKIINEAFAKREISETERDYLLSYYKDGMKVYLKAYRAIYELLGQPENTCAFDPETGKIDVDDKGRPINYGLKVLTPFVNTRLEYRDKNNNPIYVIFPKMKSVKRSIEKLKGKYRDKHIRFMKESFDKMYASEDREGFCEELQNIPSTIDSLHDVLRLTITAKYKTDVERLMRKITEKDDANFYIEESETRNRFGEPLNENAKRYYDIKMIMHMTEPEKRDDINVEIQLKINTLYHGDIQTHKIYEDVRTLEKATLDKDDLKAQKDKTHIQALNRRITIINQNRIHLYNMMVIDKARRFEEDGYKPLEVAPDFADGTYKRCRNFIENEYMPESLGQFDGRSAFSEDSELNKLCFLHLTRKLPTNFNEFSEHASAVIEQKFASLEQAEIERFEGIKEIAERYQSSVQAAITKHKRGTKAKAVLPKIEKGSR